MATNHLLASAQAFLKLWEQQVTEFKTAQREKTATTCSVCGVVHGAGKTDHYPGATVQERSVLGRTVDLCAPCWSGHQSLKTARGHIWCDRLEIQHDEILVATWLARKIVKLSLIPTQRKEQV